MIKKQYAIIAIIVATLGALTLVFGQRLGFSDVVRGAISGFIFALIAVVLHIGYDIVKSEREKEQRRRDTFIGIYLELFEFHEYLKDLFQDEKLQELDYIPPLTRTAWNTACISGYTKPDDELCFKLRHIYAATNNFVYLMNQAIDTQVKSTISGEDKKRLTSGLISLLKNMNKSLVPFIREAMTELEKTLDISSEEIGRLQANIKEQVLKHCLPVDK